MRNATTAVREAVYAQQSNTVASARGDSTKRITSVYKASNLASKLLGEVSKCFEWPKYVIFQKISSRPGVALLESFSRDYKLATIIVWVSFAQIS